MMSADDLSERDRLAEWWDRRMGDEGDLAYRAWIDPAVLEAIGEVEGRRVLDLGCGNGHFARKLARRGASVMGVDVSSEMVGRARMRETLDPLGVSYREADPGYLPWLEAESFDLVVANMALSGFGAVAAPLREAFRVLRPGGTLVCSIPHPCFAVPGHSAWLIELTETSEQVYRKVGRYLPTFVVEVPRQPGQPEPMPAYHRPLGWYFRLLLDVGFAIGGFVEPGPSAEFAAAQPELAGWLRVVPLLAVVTGVRGQGSGAGERGS